MASTKFQLTTFLFWREPMIILCQTFRLAEYTLALFLIQMRRFIFSTKIAILKIQYRLILIGSRATKPQKGQWKERVILVGKQAKILAARQIRKIALVMLELSPLITIIILSAAAEAAAVIISLRHLLFIRNF